MTHDFTPDLWATTGISAQATWKQLPLAIASSLPLVVSCCSAVIVWLVLPTMWAPIPLLFLVPSFGFQYALSMCLLKGNSLKNVHFSPRLMTVLAGGAVGATYLILIDSMIRALGFGVFAVLILVGPLSVAYAAVREVDGLKALRAGFVVAMVSPGGAVSLLGVAVLGGFLTVATAGAALLIVGPFVSIFALEMVKEIIRQIDRKTTVVA